MMHPSNPTTVLTLGTRLGGKYVVEAPIAEGGMSLVVLARDMSMDERVAVKLLKAEHRLQTDVLARFVREAKTIRRLQSERCVKVHDVGMDVAHGPFMVMEYLEGRNLRVLLDDVGRIPARRACELAIQVCEALAAAHTNDCIHRDIKPDNIMLLSRGEIDEVRVLDFGISKHTLTGSVLNQDISLIKTISLMGSPAYMSPEQMRSTALTDFRTDIWSLGAMLFEMLAGRPPFVSDSITQLCSMVISDEPPSLVALDETIPPELARVVEKCLRKNPAERFHNVGELAVALLPFAPRRSRMCVEQALSTLAAAGIHVAGREVSQEPPAFSDSTLVLPRPPVVPQFTAGRPSPYPAAPISQPPISQPPFAPSSGNIAFVAPTPSTPALVMTNRGAPTMLNMASIEKQRRRFLPIGFAAGAVIAALLVFATGFGIQSRRAQPKATLAVRAAEPAPPPPAETALPAPAEEPAEPPPPKEIKVTKPVVTPPPPPKAHVAPPPVRLATPTSATGAPTPAPAAPTSKFRVIDDEESRRPRVIE
jgi:eukaryotic-like serine/threonine-protein kinase